MKEDKRLIKSYVFHGDECYFVSTIDRDSSSCLGGRFSETRVWVFDWLTQERGDPIRWETSDREGSIEAHLRLIERIHRTGSGEEEDE